MALDSKPAKRVNALLAIENAATRKMVASLLRDSQYTIGDEALDVGHARLLLERVGADLYTVIICDKLGEAGHLDVLRYVRRETDRLPRSTPLICVADAWTAEELAQTRDFGASDILTLPLTHHTLYRAIGKSVTKQSSFISVATYCGPDRRMAVIKNYKGPFRREADKHLPRREPSRATPAPGLAPAQGGASGAVKPPARPESEIEWNRAIATGDMRIDVEHRKMIDYLKILGDASGEEDGTVATSAVLDGLRDFVVQHIEYEESLMETFDYDDKAMHKRQHAQFVARLESIGKDSASLEEQRRGLFLDVFEWIVKHITNVDRVMIAKMRGEYGATFLADICDLQTEVVINSAYDLALRITHASRIANDMAAGPSKRAHLDGIANTTERLMNLMELADVRVQINGCTDSQLRRLGEIRSALFAGAESLVESAANRLIDYSQDILSGRYGIPLGIGDTLLRQMGQLDSLAGVIGGPEAMGERSRKAVESAEGLARQVLGCLEGGAVCLEEFA
ncbi:hemerythrin domain-containing protein [Magnetospirillum sp. UT-4]|uniref:hemerythrin domain-containing protein n=1 Tax=Magnetospirillum sp. UT-4 TaxID=2681467 RepID=UPI00137CD9C9|nr:hemerythrin domain-containing protein [Magnetospirillum sp. UT-4]CAA7622272.1 Putative hemerythrin-like protein [Magnetospirillum sp. UT-4]